MPRHPKKFSEPKFYYNNFLIPTDYLKKHYRIKYYVYLVNVYNGQILDIINRTNLISSISRSLYNIEYHSNNVIFEKRFNSTTYLDGRKPAKQIVPYDTQIYICKEYCPPYDDIIHPPIIDEDGVAEVRFIEDKLIVHKIKVKEEETFRRYYIEDGETKIVRKYYYEDIVKKIVESSFKHMFVEIYRITNKIIIKQDEDYEMFICKNETDSTRMINMIEIMTSKLGISNILYYEYGVGNNTEKEEIIDYLVDYFKVKKSLFFRKTNIN